MSLNDFIFSKKTLYRLTRHIVFWIVYCTYFYLQSLPPRKLEEFFISRTYFIAFVNLCVFAPVFVASSYFTVYILLPKTLIRKRYMLFMAAFILLYIVGTFINYFTAELFLIITNFFPNTFQHRIEMSNYNTRWGMIIAFVAMGIKLTKNWYLQQNENLEIVKKKTRMEIQLEKGRIHPELLLRSLDTIYSNIQTHSNNAPAMILNLSELLSCSLYENANEMVLLEKELQQLRHLITLEQQDKERSVDIEMNTTGDINNKFIAPMVLVKMLEQNITLLHKAGVFSCFARLALIVENDNLFSTLSFSDASVSGINWVNCIGNLRNSLGAYYATSDFHIELFKSKSEMIITLQLKLIRGTEANYIGSGLNLKETAHDLI